MTYNFLTIGKLAFIQIFWSQDTKSYVAAKALKRSAETIYRIYRFLDTGKTISEYYENYQTNKAKSKRKPISLPNNEIEYLKEKS